jgi:phenylacetaldehyde dehydrogenase
MNAQLSPDRSTSLTAEFLAKPHELFIGGEWMPARSGKTFDVINPATGQVIAKAAAADAADIDAAVKAARKAFENPPWSTMNPSARAKLMWKLAEAIEANADLLGTLETMDNGMPFRVSRFVAALGAAENLRYNAGWAGKIVGETPNISAPNHHVYTLREPVGVVGAIVPWNFPMAMAVSKIAPAIAAGCTVVLKPAELTPLTAIRLAQLIQEVGFPPGVINVVTGFGDPAGKALVEHPDVDKISFTGSTVVGKSILAGAAGNLKRVTLELGGKSPVIVFPDADLDRATEGAATGIFMNAGQVCVAGSRLYVQRRVFDAVLEGVSTIAGKMRIGPGLESGTQLGPLVSERQLQRVEGYVRTGLDEGATLVAGGQRHGDRGWFHTPTILTGLSESARVVQEEIFGPVLVATPFDDVADIAALANATAYGLSASIWSNDLKRVHRLIPRIKAGTVWVNCHGLLDNALPFGGYKQSGMGREMGRAMIDLYTETKSVMMMY